VTPEIEIAQRRVDVLSRSIESECKVRGDRCRELESRQEKALDDLATARRNIALSRPILKPASQLP
jgi:hypothetical protein